jgi:hypothetical protein
MNTLHKISQADMLAVLDNQADEDNDSIVFNLAVTGDWSGEGRIDFAAPSGSSTGPFLDVKSFSFVATSSFGTTEFSANNLAFAYWNVGPSGLMISFSILTNPVDGFSLSMQLGKDAAKLDGKKFATLDVGTLTHSPAQSVAIDQQENLKRICAGAPFLREV